MFILSLEQFAGQLSLLPSLGWKRVLAKGLRPGSKRWWYGGSAVGRWTCDLYVAGSIPGRWLPRNIGQLSLASLRGR